MYIVLISLTLLISFFLAVLIGLIIIPILKRKKINQNLSIYLEERHASKKNTPTMGGIIFIMSSLITILVLIILKRITFSYNFLIVLFVLISYALIGFIDDFLIIKRNSNNGLTELTKLLFQIIIAIIFFLLFLQENEPLIWIQPLRLKLDIGWYYGLFILFILVASSNAVNLTDGLDGLATGLDIIAFMTFGIITYFTGWLEGYESISLLCFVVAGSLLGFLTFNIYPAKIFMGDTGSLSLGATLGTVSILTRHELLLIVIGIVFVVETMTCLIQRYYYKLTHKRIFPMAPIHHTFEKMGWNEQNIVRLFWLVGLIGALIALILR